MLADADTMAFVPTRDPQKSRAFFEKTLGLKFISEDPFAMVFDSNGVMLRIVNVSGVKEFKPYPFTILGWRVASIETTVRGLTEGGVKFERYAGFEQSDLGIWRSPAGVQVAWFKDPDGNILSLSDNASEAARH